MELKRGMESKLDTSCCQSNKTVRVWKRREKKKNKNSEVQSGMEGKWPSKNKMSGRWKKGGWGGRQSKTQSADKESHMGGN